MTHLSRCRQQRMNPRRHRFATGMKEKMISVRKIDKIKESIGTGTFRVRPGSKEEKRRMLAFKLQRLGRPYERRREKPRAYRRPFLAVGAKRTPCAIPT